MRYKYKINEQGPTYSRDGLLFFLPIDRAEAAIKKLRQKGYKRGNGEVGYGLYSPTWDRQMAEKGDIKTIDGYIDGWWFNPSLAYYIWE